MAGVDKGFEMRGHATNGHETGSQGMAHPPDPDGLVSGAVAVPTTVEGKTSGSPRKKRPHSERRPAECGDLPFLIKRDGTWLYKGTAIGRKELVCLFASVLRREADGSFWLETPAERGRIRVEDAPFVVVEMDWNGERQRAGGDFPDQYGRDRLGRSRSSDPAR